MHPFVEVKHGKMRNLFDLGLVGNYILDVERLFQIPHMPFLYSGITSQRAL